MGVRERLEGGLFSEEGIILVYRKALFLGASSLLMCVFVAIVGDYGAGCLVKE